MVQTPCLPTSQQACEQQKEQGTQTQQVQVSFDMSSPLSIDEVRADAGQGDERCIKALAGLARLSEDKRPTASVAILHRLATQRGRGQYIDPNTGFMVFTATFLKQRDCCNLGCRHCPHLGTAGTCSTGKAEKGKETTAIPDW